ncbi:glucosamine-6-phosphate deaminase [Acidipila sp. 4G-K13]|uniref:Glucosamine-6-phosphate deaminase n=2 Tax=Paracidobacterium acidisoli TaxID=2303751 RepID=A0A372IJZ0_9BACT|nr:glucosamine-6-phosphate deaminase [Paracidobacterium acidisoli]
MPNEEVKHITVDRMKIEIHHDTASAGRAAAEATAQAIQELKQQNERLAVIFATGASQLAMLDALIARADVPWKEIEGFHLDEYVGISENHRASFRRYLRERLTQRVTLGSFFEIQGDAPDPEAICRQYAQRLEAAQPQLCLLGIGENGHLAFNDPAEANFGDPLDVKIVNLDAECREQQVAEGWFSGPAEVPSQAITVTIPALMRVPRLIVSVPGPRKAAVMRRTVEEAISTACPATILRQHPDATIYLDRESAAELESLPLSR